MSLLLMAEEIDELVKCCRICRYHWGCSFIWIITIWQLFYGWGVNVALTRVHGPSNDRGWRTEWTRDQHSPRQVIIWWQMTFPYSNLISVRIFLFEIALNVGNNVSLCHIYNGRIQRKGETLNAFQSYMHMDELDAIKCSCHIPNIF